jgi:hypothetical protein
MLHIQQASQVAARAVLVACTQEVTKGRKKCTMHLPGAYTTPRSAHLYQGRIQQLCEGAGQQSVHMVVLPALLCCDAEDPSPSKCAGP